MGNPYRIIMHETGGTDVLKVEEFEPRPPGPGEALVKQAASGLNFIDTYFRTGLYPVKLPFVQGSEGAGTVEAVGEGVTDVKPGDRVAYLGNGTYATHFTGPAARMVKLPDGISEDIGPEIRDALFKLTGMRWQVELGNDAGAPTLREQEEAEKSAADAALREEPLVKATLEAFPDAEILDDKAVVAQAGGRKWNR